MMEEKSKLDLLLSSFRRCRKEQPAPAPAQLTSLLVLCQEQLTPFLLDDLPSHHVARALRETWKFLLLCASDASSAVRLLAYRTTGAFLLRMMRHFPYLLQRTFADVTMESTIDMKSSGVIAGAFAFISKNVGTPVREAFLNMTPVFHHLTISDPIFSEHLPSIIGNLGDLGVDWYRTLLHSFLELYFNLNSGDGDSSKAHSNSVSSNTNILKSISEIVKHEKMVLMNEVLLFIGEKKDYRSFLPLISFVLAYVKFDFDDIDLSLLAESAMDVLDDIDNSGLIDIDSAIQILSTKTNSFSLSVFNEKDEDFKFILKTKNGERVIVFNAHKCLMRPSFYLLKCPIDFCIPKESDGVLTLTSKFKELANIVKVDADKTEFVFNIFLKHINEKYDEHVSAVIQGIAICLPELIQRIEHLKVLSLLKSIVFADIEGWFHAVDVLLIIEQLSLEQITNFFGENGLMKIIDVLLKLLLFKNDRIKNMVLSILKNNITPITYELITNKISESIDFFDEESLIPTLEILTNILNSFPNYQKTHLNSLLTAFIEYFPFSKNNLFLMIKIFDFLSCFDLSSYTYEEIKYPYLRAQLILAASFQVIFGFNLLDKFVPVKKLPKMISIIEKDIKSKEIDVISEKELNYKVYLAPAYSALMLFNKISPDLMDNDFAGYLLSQTVIIFPLESISLLKKFWKNLSQLSKSNVLYSSIQSLTFIQDFEFVKILCQLFFDYFEEFGGREESVNKILDYVSFAVKNKKYSTPEQFSVFSAFQSFFSDKSNESISQLKIQFNQKIVFDKLLSCGKQYKFTNYSLDDLTMEQNIDSPIIITQLKSNKYSFNIDKLQLIFDHCVKTDDKNLLEHLLNYASKQKIKINIENKEKLSMNLEPLIIQYIKSNKYSELDEIANRHKQKYDNLPQTLFSALVSAFPDDYIEFLRNQTNVSKLQLRTLLKSISHISFYQNKLISLILNLICTLKSERKIEYCLMILNIIIYRMKAITESLASQILDIIEKKFKDHLYILSLSLYLLAPKYQSVKLLTLTSQCIQLASPISHELYFLNYVLVNYDKRNAYDSKKTPKLQVPLLQLNIPSSYFYAIKIITLFIKNFPESKELFIKNNLALIMNNIPTFLNIYPVSENLMYFLNLLLSSSLPKKYYEKILNDLDKWLPKQKDASFHSFCNYFVNFYKAACKINSDQIPKFLQTMETLKTTPGNSFFMSKYLKMLDYVTSQKNEKEMYAMNSVTTWLDNDIINSDCYFASNIMYDWCVYLYKNVYFTEFLPIITIHFIKNGNRFFPIFVGLTKFILAFLKQCSDSEKKEQLLLSISAAADMFKMICHAHGKAIEIMLNKDLIKTALQLALFEKDCSMSDSIIHSIKK